MVKIDGDKVRQLREQKGLTQLYIATVVQVTTDTISRWENKRYPTIKKENGLRLAEALEVDLEEILKIEEDSDESPEMVEPAGQPETTPPPTPRARSRWPLFTAVVAMAVALAATLAYLQFFSKEQPVEIQARRILPPGCTVGQPFPVAIEVKIPHDNQLAIIVKEQLPTAIRVKATSPPLPSPEPKNNSLKWLKKIEGKGLFTYIATLKEPLSAGQVFSGSVATGNDGGKSFNTAGPSSIKLTTFHWADSDGDNIISDQEILAVYDQYGDLEKLGIDVDLIEEIWLGSGYSWNEKKKTYEVLP